MPSESVNETRQEWEGLGEEKANSSLRRGDV